MEMKIYKNPNPQEFAEISEAVKLNDGYCPCLLNKNDDTKCMCKDFRDSTESDFCHCGRYYKIKEFETIALVGNKIDQINFWNGLLEKQSFVVIPVLFEEENSFHATNQFMDLCKTKIARANAVLLLDEITSDWLIEMETWATMLNKKIIHWSDLTK
jgi:hypothetical protein